MLELIRHERINARVQGSRSVRSKYARASDRGANGGRDGLTRKHAQALTQDESLAIMPREGRGEGVGVRNQIVTEGTEVTTQKVRAEQIVKREGTRKAVGTQDLLQKHALGERVGAPRNGSHATIEAREGIVDKR